MPPLKRRRAGHDPVANRLADLINEFNIPRRTLWRSFLTGIATGAGLVVGGSLVGALLLVTLMGVLKQAFLAAGGIPWVGAELKQGLGFILQAIHEHQALKP